MLVCIKKQISKDSLITQNITKWIFNTQHTTILKKKMLMVIDTGANKVLEALFLSLRCTAAMWPACWSAARSLLWSAAPSSHPSPTLNYTVSPVCLHSTSRTMCTDTEALHNQWGSGRERSQGTRRTRIANPSPYFIHVRTVHLISETVQIHLRKPPIITAGRRG